MQWSVHLVFSGQCEEAFRFYERLFDGKIVGMLAYGASHVPDEWRDKIVHATVVFGGKQLSGADVLPKDFAPPRGFYLLIDADDVNEAQRTFTALAEGGSVRMPLQKTFWSPAFGVVVDRFGVPWEISTRWIHVRSAARSESLCASLPKNAGSASIAFASDAAPAARSPCATWMHAAL